MTSTMTLSPGIPKRGLVNHSAIGIRKPVYVGRRPDKGDRFSNETFQEYRGKTGRGGDFMIYSDMKVVKLPSPEYFLGP